MRAKARAEGKPMRYDGRWRDRDPAEAPPGVKPVIRLRAQQDGETIVDDKVQGKVIFANKDLDDLVLLRSDGNPTYMLAVVVDDHDMGVTHIIRGDDHLTNAARQMQIYGALGWDVPIMAHIPLIHGPDGAKLSKRHGALGVDAYRAMGYLPAALRNYLARLGWSHGDREFFSTEELIEAFDLPAIGRSPSRFDYAKLENMNGHFMRATPDDALLTILLDALPYLPGGPELAAKLDPHRRAQLAAALPGLKERAKTLVELVDGAAFLFAARPLTMDAKAARDSRQWRARTFAGAAAAPDRNQGLERRGDRGRRALLRRSGGGQARRGRPTVARGADRALDLAGHLRRARRARPRGESRAHSRPGRGALSARRGPRRLRVVILSYPLAKSLSGPRRGAGSDVASTGDFRLPIAPRLWFSRAVAR